MSYIDVLPKELRNELQCYRNDMLTQFINEQFAAHALFFGASDENEALIMLNKFKNEIIPSKIIAQVFARKWSDSHHFKGYFKILSNQLMTFDTLIQIYNNMYKTVFTHEFQITDYIRSLNNKLKIEGWSERLLLYPNDNTLHHVVIVNEIDIKNIHNP